eukprot:4887-Heterococcus_DN1.PRE.2
MYAAATAATLQPALLTLELAAVAAAAAADTAATATAIAHDVAGPASQHDTRSESDPVPVPS